MIRSYLIERRSWIFLFIFLQLLFLLIAYVDPNIPLYSIMYVVFLSIIIFILFLVFRYQKETAFFRRLEERDQNFDLSGIPAADSPFEKTIEKHLIEQTEQFRTTVSKNRIALEQEKDDMLSWIHEVKTPLTALHLMIERLEDPLLRSHLTYEWTRIHLLLDQQLHQKRLPFMENDLYIEQTNLESILFSELKTLQSWCIQKGIGFDIQLEVTEVLSDAKWLAFILSQLLTNAVKYSDSSDILIRSYQLDDHTILEVADSGRGIDPKDLPRIFEKGFTSTTNHLDHAATGMGLYLARKAANTLFIHIEVQSELRLGTTFTLKFPTRNEFVKRRGM
ncbi:OmpR family two-component system bacitracin resistance sensor histidine kinase BceS [Bacillus ectoiniformans]|uniref:sensor histidine kinase n=1 Tax=Bacillus ectoiniformans TaxID=1494429 RepID=UPI00195C7857|nr:sensor histidine kinase [Bacillus ectoiniformans]MBM7648204.1 OmpR family two-component system bacitracin resistance sensor histidine kinase BceS [Bacillus ectoiniformans]